MVDKKYKEFMDNQNYNLNDLQLYQLYLSIPLWTIDNPSRIYPKYVVITGRSFAAPHPHRHYEFDEFIDKLYKDDKFRSVIENK